MPASAVRLYAPSAQFPTTIQEQFYDPNTNQIIGTDNQVWQYNFTNLPNPFIQQGTTALPKIYWLDVQAITSDPNAIFGWKTSIPPHRLDDAVFADTQGFNGPLLPVSGNPGGLPWTDMHYPTGHPFGGQSFDLSFVITTVPEPTSFALIGVGLLVVGLLGGRRSHR
jgi:PEP-CTERM motif